MRVIENTTKETKKSLKEKEELVTKLKKIKFSRNPKKYKKIYYLINKDKYFERYKKYYLLNKEHKKQYDKKYKIKNKERIKLLVKRWYKKNKEHKKQYDKKYKSERSEHYKKMNKQYRKNNRNKINKHLLNKYHTNIHYKLSCILRKRVIKSLKGYSKSKKTMELLGCTIDKLWKHLKNKFQPGMTKENHGQWHLDHVRPCASFDLTDPKQQAMCFHYTNLQPLWAVDNLKKGAKHETINA